MKIFTTILAVLASCFCFVANGQEHFVKKTMTSGRDTLRYCELAPRKVERGKKLPLVLFLHGRGEAGTDNEKQLIHGSQQFLNPANRDRYPCYVLFPQCPESVYWAYASRPASLMPADMPLNSAPTREMEMVYDLVMQYVAEGKVDAKRIYVMGLSMGGMGTFDIVIRHPETFAAAVAMCGSVNPERITPAVKNVKWRIFHGDADLTVPIDGSRAAYRALKEVGAQVRYTEFPGVTHGCWNPAFQLPDFMEWLFEQKRK